MFNIFTFNLDLKINKSGEPLFAEFPFIVNGNPVEGFACGISSVFAGDMKYGRKNPNRQKLFNELEQKHKHMHMLKLTAKVYGINQIHSQTVLPVDSENPPLIEADGMVTNDKDITLSVTVADCLPVFLLDVKTSSFGIVHSGWKGTGIVLSALALLTEKWKTNSADVAAVLGPCIGACCYKVDKERASVFEKDFGAESVRKDGGSFFLDLKLANIKLLKEAGVRNIAVCENCTFCDERLGSFRREGEKFTRMAAVLHGSCGK
jgi:YfiH family protein